MPEITHLTRSIRIAPRKMRLIIDKIRHLSTEDALKVLPLVPNRGALPIERAVKAAVEAAKDANLDPATLVIQRAWADEGKALKRMVMHGRGRSAQIQKKYSHIGLVIKGEEKVRSKRARTTTKTDAAAETPSEVPAITEGQE